LLGDCWIVRLGCDERLHLGSLLGREVDHYTARLAEGAQRAFVAVPQGRPVVLYNLQTTLVDNMQKKQVNLTFPEIDPGRINPNTSQYFWWDLPRTPGVFRFVQFWDEDYTIAVTPRGEKQLTEHLVLRGTTEGLHFAVELAREGRQKPFLSCEGTFAWPSPEHPDEQMAPPCSSVMFLPKDVQDRLRNGLSRVQGPDGAVTIMKLPENPITSHPERRPVNRRLTDWQKNTLIGELRPYAGSRLLVLSTQQSEPLRYARDYRETFAAAGWLVTGPEAAPIGGGQIIDVQVSGSGSDFASPRRELTALVKALKDAGVKSKNGPVCDPNVSKDIIVLWVGVQSPDEISPDMFPGYEFPPRAIRRIPQPHH
jgi:hypothetical protein